LKVPLSAEVGEVLSVEPKAEGLDEVRLRLPEGEAVALSYRALIGELRPGDMVAANVTAVELGLGTGGTHFVLGRVGKGSAEGMTCPGHIMKMRYTPYQFSVLSVEEPGSPHHQAVRDCQDIGGMPVVACCLHSMVAAAAAGVSAVAPEARVAYVMTDAASLPIAVSDLVRSLTAARLLRLTVTAGQAFGGDLEAVNLFSALTAAKAVGDADIAIVSQGPGNVGTSTPFGFGGIEQAEIIHTAFALGGVPVAVLRISFSDPRPRHRGLSAHSKVALGRATLCRARVVVPDLEDDKRQLVAQELESSGIAARHDLVWESGEPGLRRLEELGLRISTMGRSTDEDREYFLAAAAAGIHAAKLLQGRS
jgi:hypothetical protein